MQIRQTVFSHPGGDTVFLNALARELRRLGLYVDIDSDGTCALENYDLVHLFNFATPEITECFARQAVNAGVPYVVTTLYEDAPRFYNQMIAQFVALECYVEMNQERTLWPQLASIVSQCESAPPLENAWTVANAAALFVTGKTEEATLRRDYKIVPRIETVPVGCDLNSDANPNLFINEYQVRDFVLCVGRLETRKNQLTLLKALEEVDMPLVFATGGFSYQLEYEAACKRFRRKGRTLFVERLSNEMLASAYAACRVHALPSWYELPGLVSLEAARYGTNIVVTDYGTARDYFGDAAYYCDPKSPETLRDAVDIAASERGKSADIVARDFTWRANATRTLQVYEEILSANR